MLKAAGFTDDLSPAHRRSPDMDRDRPCNFHLHQFGAKVKSAALTPMGSALSISDGIA
jgi:hypothetical protein